MTSSEIDLFLHAAQETATSVWGFCWMLAVTGCRISEALSFTKMNIDFEAGHVIIKSLKKRGKRVFRAVPLPTDYLIFLKNWFESELGEGERLWPWSRMTGYRRICEVMAQAHVTGSYATPKGLRHGFGVKAIQSNVPLTLVQRWLGHADIKTTAIYTSAMGPEEREIASRMWRKHKPKRASRPQLANRSDKSDLRGIWSRNLGEVSGGVHSVPPAKNGRRRYIGQYLMRSCERLVGTAIHRFRMNPYCLVRQNWIKCNSYFLCFS